MGENSKPRLKVVTGGQARLEALHDKVMTLLETQEKRGIRQLLNKNSQSCKKLLFPFISADIDQAAVMAALAGILEAHARECYTIGYLDCMANGPPVFKNFKETAEPNP